MTPAESVRFRHRMLCSARVLHGDDSCRERQVPPQDVVLQVEAQVRAVQPHSVLPACGGWTGRLQRFAQRGADDALVAQLRAEGRLAQWGFQRVVQVQPVHVGAVVVEGHGFRTSAHQFEAVFRSVPVDGRAEAVGRACCFCLYGGEVLARVLELVVVLRAVKRVCPVVLLGEARVPLHVHPLVGVPPLVEGFAPAEIAVQAAGGIAAEAVAARVAARHLVAVRLAREAGMSPAVEEAVRASFGMKLHAALRVDAGHDVDGAHQRRGAVHAAGRAFEHFDAFNLTNVYRKIGGVVAGLGVADVDAVQKDGDLVERSPPDADVRLYSHVAPLADIDANGVLQQVVHTLCGRGGDVVAVEHSYHARRLPQGCGDTRARDAYFLQLVLHFPGLVFYLCGNRLGVGKCQHRDDKHTDVHLQFQAAENSIRASGEVLETYGTTEPFHAFFLHCYLN